MKSMLVCLLLISLISGVVEAGEGILNITSYPSGAEVKIDNRLIGVTPLTEDLESGDYSLKVSMVGYGSIYKDIVVFENDVLVEKIILKKHLGNINNNLLLNITSLLNSGRLLVSTSETNTPISLNLEKHRSGSQKYDDLIQGLYCLDIGNTRSFIEIIDESFVKVNYDGKNIEVKYTEDTQKLLNNYASKNSNIEWLTLSKGLKRSQMENVPMFMINSGDLTIFERVYNNSDASVRGYMSDNCIFVTANPDSKEIITVNGISTPESVLASHKCLNRDVYLESPDLVNLTTISLNEYGMGDFEENLHHIRWGIYLSKVVSVKEITQDEYDKAYWIKHLNGKKDLLNWIGQKPVVLLFTTESHSVSPETKKIGSILNSKGIEFIHIWIRDNKISGETFRYLKPNVLQNSHAFMGSKGLNDFKITRGKIPRLVFLNSKGEEEIADERITRVRPHFKLDQKARALLDEMINKMKSN